MKSLILKSLFIYFFILLSFITKGQDISLIFHDAIIVNDSVYGYCFVNKEISTRYNKTIFKVGFSNSNFNGIKDEIEIEMKDGYNLSGIQVKEGRLMVSIYESVNTQVPFSKNEYERKIIIVDLIEKVIKSERTINEKINIETEWSLVGDSKILNFKSSKPGNSPMDKTGIMTLYDQYLNELYEYNLVEDDGKRFSSYSEQNINSNEYIAYKIYTSDKLWNKEIGKTEDLKIFSIKDNLIFDKIRINNETDSNYYNLEYIFVVDNSFYLYQEIIAKTNKKSIQKSIGLKIKTLERKDNVIVPKEERIFLWNELDSNMPETTFNYTAKFKTQLWSGLNKRNIYYAREKSYRIIKSYQEDDNIAFVRKDLFNINVFKDGKQYDKVIADTISIIKVSKDLSKLSINKINIGGNKEIKTKEIVSKEIFDFMCLYNPNIKKLNIYITVSGIAINMLLDDKNDLKSDLIKFDTKATNNFILPAKPGYMFLMDYYEKDKKLTPRLEKLAY